MMLAVHATGAVAVELPYRRRVYHATWSYAIGQAVKFGKFKGLVLSRQRTAMGCQIYLLWVMGPSAGRPYRWVKGAALVPT